MNNIPENMVKPHANYACLTWNVGRWQSIPKRNGISDYFFAFADWFYAGNRKVYVVRELETTLSWTGRYIITRVNDDGKAEFAIMDATAKTFDDLRGGVSYGASTLE